VNTQIGNGIRDMKNFKAPNNFDKALLYCVGLILLLALLGFMENRDREHRAEMVAQQCSNTGD